MTSPRITLPYHTLQPAPSTESPVTTAVSAGTTGEMTAKQLLPKGKILVVKDNDAALQALITGKAQALMADFLTGLRLLGRALYGQAERLGIHEVIGDPGAQIAIGHRLFDLTKILTPLS